MAIAKCKYVLTQLVLGTGCEVKLSKREYERIADAKRGLSRALAIEERYDVFIANFEELELEILRIANRNMIYLQLSWEDMQSVRTLLNRRVLNFLSSARAYIDQTQHDFSELFGKDSPRLAKICRCFNDAYDRSLGYRAIEALRNYSQHAGAPIHWLSYPSRRDLESGKLSFSVEYSINLEMLEKDKKFKKAVLEELRQQYDKRVSLRALVRQYVEEMGEVQEQARAILGSSMTRWEKTENEAIARYVDSCGEEKIGLASAKIKMRGDHEDGVLEEFDLNGKVAERRTELSQRNRKIEKCENRLVVSVPE